MLIIGGRQSAYEWAALLGEHNVEHAVTSFTVTTSRASSG